MISCTRRAAQLALSAGAAFAALIGFATASQAATVTVNTTTVNDPNDGKCGLAEAVRATNQQSTYLQCTYTANGQSDKIVVPAGTHTASSQISVTRSVEIVGAGIASTVFESGGGYAIGFTGYSAPNPLLKLRNMTIKRRASQFLPVTGVQINSGGFQATLIMDSVRIADFNSPGIHLSGPSVYATITNSTIENSSPGLYVDQASLTLSSSTVRSNKVGLHIVPLDDFTVTDIIGSTISNNTGVDGAGIRFEASDLGTHDDKLTITSSTISGNQATGNGGGIYATNFFTATDSVFDNNTAASAGGGLYIASEANGATCYLRGVTVSNNRAVNGAGIYLGGGGFINVYQSTLGPANVASGDGGGLHSAGQIGVMENTTIANNQAVRGGGVFHNSGGESHFFHVTSAFNKATQAGGGGGFWLTTGNPLFSYNVVARNTAGGGASPPLSNVVTSNPSLSATYNLLDDASGVTAIFPTSANGGTNLVGVNAQLGSTLTNLGGNTKVLRLLGGSPGIDAIPPSADSTAIDQRGQVRPVDGNLDGFAALDIGAVEMKATSAALFEGETMTVAAKSAETLTTENNNNYSAGAASVFQVNSRGAASPFVTYKSPSIAAGTYGVWVRFKKASNAGVFALAAGSAANSVTALGLGQDAFSFGVSWKTVSMGSITLSSAGAHYFQFALVAKNFSSSAYWLYLDSIGLVTTN